MYMSFSGMQRDKLGTCIWFMLDKKWTPQRTSLDKLFGNEEVFETFHLPETH